MDKQNNSRAAISTGMVSLITFFTILLLASFSVLIITSTRSEGELANRAADTIKTYYQADSYAEEKVMEVDTVFIASEYDFQTTESLLYESGFPYTITVDTLQNLLYVEYKIEVDENRELAVKLVLNETGEIQREQWQLMPKSY